MSVTNVHPAARDPYHVGHGGHQSQAPGHGECGPAPKRIVVGYGFWIFLLSDIIMFSAFFAAYAVLVGETAGGPTGAELFDLRGAAVETTCLLLSSFACGLASLAAQARRSVWFHLSMLATFLLGGVFLLFEAGEFADMIARGAGPTRSAFLSAFFTLVGCHGLHVSVGLLWLLTMMAQIFVKGFTPRVYRRMLCFNLFWHALDIIWIGIFTFVYLIGARA